jgi:hypothetical protein
MRVGLMGGLHRQGLLWNQVKYSAKSSAVTFAPWVGILVGTKCQMIKTRGVRDRLNSFVGKCIVT